MDEEYGNKKYEKIAIFLFVDFVIFKQNAFYFSAMLIIIQIRDIELAAMRR